MLESTNQVEMFRSQQRSSKPVGTYVHAVIKPDMPEKALRINIAAIRIRATAVICPYIMVHLLSKAYNYLRRWDILDGITR